MSLSRSTYYARPARAAARADADTTLRSAIEAVLLEWPQYGYRRVTQELRRHGTVVNRKRIARIMRTHALTRQTVRRFLATTDSGHAEPVFPNLAASCVPTGPNQLWVADLTYIRLTTEFVFLAVVLDAWSRKVIGYALSHLLDARLPLAALDAALASRRPAPGLVHHSDRGVQYAARAYRARLAQHGIVGSMSRCGNPYDNAFAESFFKTLKYEEILLHGYRTMDDVLSRLPHFLDEIYNCRRLHSALGYRPPEEFETLNLQPAA
jgi:putative transposase